MIDNCVLCKREASLTNHHLIPKMMHRRKFFKKTYIKEELNCGIFVCGHCHKGLHKFFTGMELAKELNTLEAILANEPFKKHIAWAAKQKKR